MLEFKSRIPEEFRLHSRVKHLESQWKFNGIPLEYHRNTAADFVQIYRMFSRIIPTKYHSFLTERTGILMEILWYFYGIFVVFSRIWVVFWWNFSGLLMKFQSKKQCERSYLKNLTSIFAEFFIYFLILLYPTTEWKKPCTVGI